MLWKYSCISALTDVNTYNFWFEKCINNHEIIIKTNKCCKTFVICKFMLTNIK